MGETMIAYCGLICTDCPAYIATAGGDGDKLSALAREWSTPECPLSAGECECDGCRGGGRLASFVEHCEIRRCALEREVETCGHCGMYPCTLLAETFRRSPQAKAVLDEIARGRSPET